MRSLAPTAQATFRPTANASTNYRLRFGGGFQFIHSFETAILLTLYSVLYLGQMGNTTDDLAEMVGLPTEQDKEKIRRAILRYEKKHPGYIQAAIEQARGEHRAEGLHTDKAKYGVVNKQAHGRVLFELPNELGQQITSITPFVFKNKKHLRWFIKHFPELLIPSKY